MTGTLPRLFAIQFLSWSAMFCLWIYALPVIAAVLGGSDEAAVPTVGLCFSGYALAGSVLALGQPWLFARVPPGVVHGAALLVGAAGMAALGIATRAVELVPAFAAVAISWSTIGTVPYAAAASAAPPGRGAATLRRFGFSTILPQAVTTLGLAALAARWRVPGASVMLLGAAELATAGVLTLWWRHWIVVPAEEW